MSDWCLSQVRTQDYERYLTTLFMPQKMRAPLWALYAFNIEIAKTRDVVSQSTLGLIRLQWWRDTITRLYDGHIDAHEVIIGLAGYKHLWKLDDFIALIDAREGDFDPDNFTTEKAFCNHADAVSNTLLKMVLSVENTSEEKSTFEKIAYAYGVIRALRSASFQNNASFPFWPEDMNPENIVRHIIANLPKKTESKTLRLYRKLTLLHCKKLGANHYDPFDKNMIEPDNLLPLKLWVLY